MLAGPLAPGTWQPHDDFFAGSLGAAAADADGAGAILSASARETHRFMSEQVVVCGQLLSVPQRCRTMIRFPASPGIVPISTQSGT